MFSKDVVKNKRDAIAGIIRNLSAEQNPGKTFNFPNLIFCPTQGSGYTDDEDDSEDSSSGFNKSFSSPATSSSSSSIFASGISSKTIATPVKGTGPALAVSSSGGSKSALVCIPIKRPGGGAAPAVTTATSTAVTSTATKLLTANNTKMTPVPNPNSSVAKPAAPAAAPTPAGGSKGGILITKKDGNFSLKKVNGLTAAKPVVSIPLLPKSVTMTAAASSTGSSATAVTATSSTAKAAISSPTTSAPGHDSTNGKVNEGPAVNIELNHKEPEFVSGAAGSETSSSSGTPDGQGESGSTSEPMAKKARVESSEADSVVDSTTTESSPVSKCEAPSSTS